MEIEKGGGWPVLDVFGKLELGMEHREVPKLRERLHLSGDLLVSSESSLFDDSLKEAVVRFQSRHGLKPDGIVGSRTRAALNVPVEIRMDQIRLNMERWRWMPKALEERYLLVNLANFSLSAIEQ